MIAHKVQIRFLQNVFFLLLRSLALKMVLWYRSFSSIIFFICIGKKSLRDGDGDGEGDELDKVI